MLSILIVYLLYTETVKSHRNPESFFNRYSVEDLETKYLVNMKVEICLEHGKPCLISQDVANGVYLPKIGCDWTLDFSGAFLCIHFAFSVLKSF
jgi:hypothetical protein